MAITVHIFYTGENGSAERFAREMTEGGTVAAIRAEEGSLRYEYFRSLDDPETILLVDSWRDQGAIDAHHASPMMETVTALRERYNLRMRVERYVEDQVPAKDEAFIRA